MIIGYSRVSTTEQNLDLQRDALKRAGCEKIIEDTFSGGKVQRRGLERVHDALRSGDVLAVWRLDRLGRSLKHLIELMGELEAVRTDSRVSPNPSIPPRRAVSLCFTSLGRPRTKGLDTDMPGLNHRAPPRLYSDCVISRGGCVVVSEIYMHSLIQCFASRCVRS